MKTFYAAIRFFLNLYLAIVFCFYADYSDAQNVLLFPTTIIPATNRGNITLRVSATKAITAIQIQEINFGTYCVTGTAGGTITVGWDGNRTATGDIVLMSMSPIAQPAIFEIKT